MFKVYIIESELGHGAKLDSIQEFETKEKAEAFVLKFNAENDKKSVPDWYMYATMDTPPAHVSRRVV